MSRCVVLWRRLDSPGCEYFELQEYDGGFTLRGVVLMTHDGTPCRVEYDIDCNRRWLTRMVRINSIVRTPQSLLISRSENGAWQVNGQSEPLLNGCDDIDLQFTPSTNLLPIRRLNLGVGEEGVARAAWVRFPDLSVEVLAQVYRRLGDRDYEYESADGAFRKTLRVNRSGVVVEYPDQWIAEATSFEA